MTEATTKPVTGGCNFLMPAENVAIGGVAGAVTKKMGNWVGGRFELDDVELRLSMNALNKAFQKDHGAIVIPRAAIRQAREGRMFWLFLTIDLETDRGLVRIRPTPAGGRALKAAFAL